jgi:hypothetical protein
MSEFHESVLHKPRSFKVAFLPVYCCIIANSLIDKLRMSHMDDKSAYRTTASQSNGAIHISGQPVIGHFTELTDISFCTTSTVESFRRLAKSGQPVTTDGYSSISLFERRRKPGLRWCWLGCGFGFFYRGNI